ncbi:MAG TPA: type II secretion system F family protein [Bryobacteraceae bacterium]|nr:type II secretion system F family protein [Bryobacteraceae bacterium]
MSTTFLVLTFLVIFTIVMVAIAVGQNVVETAKKKKVTEMLQTAVGQAQQADTKVLFDAGETASAVMQFIGHFNFIQKLEVKLQQSGVGMSLKTLFLAMFLCAIPGALLGAKFKLLVSTELSIAVLAVVFASFPYLYIGRKRTKRMAAFEEQFPEALEFLSRAMRAGHAFSIALEMLSEESPQPLAGEFRKVYNETNLGLPIEVALRNVTDRMPLLDLKFFVAAVLLQRETGGNLAEILTNLAHVIRERFKLKGQVRSASAHGRMTGTILTLMPVALMFGMLAVAPGYLQGMVADPLGRKMVIAVVIGVVLGHFTIRKIVNIKV